MNRITPGELIAHTFRPTDLERELHVSRSTIWRWGQPVPKGTGGLIPSRYHAPLLRMAAERSIVLTADDLVLGRHNPSECGYNPATSQQAA